jgi:hypothetical protein
MNPPYTVKKFTDFPVFSQGKFGKSGDGKTANLFFAVYASARKVAKPLNHPSPLLVL